MKCPLLDRLQVEETGRSMVATATADCQPSLQDSPLSFEVSNLSDTTPSVQPDMSKDERSSPIRTDSEEESRSNNILGLTYSSDNSSDES